nr:MAG TPA: hypothetical protein [Caudoviricetes sp.]
MSIFSHICPQARFAICLPSSIAIFSAACRSSIFSYTYILT